MEHVDVAVIGGGQSGLATAHALRQWGVEPVVLEASDRAAGSWPRYYDSLTLFSPARYSSLPGMPFPGANPDRYPHRDEVADYLTAYAAGLDADIRTGRRVTAVRRADGGFEVELAGGGRVAARAVVAASGTFGRPHRPALPGLEGFTGTVLHTAEYRSPHRFAGQRVVVVGAGNSAVQIAAELASVARVSLAGRAPVKFARQHIGGRDLHFWLKRTGLDIAPLGRLLHTPPTQLVIDDGRYRAALAQGAPDRRELFTGIDGTKALWPDGTREEVDAIVLATGYRPDLPYLTGLDGALDAAGQPRHRDGASLTYPGLAFVGLEWQRSLSSNSLRGVGRDADRVARRLAHRHTRG
ncbi:NAD(P)/FAD-dependent oxidoreductase (plasmid) [Streptomyces sp. NBC_00841]|uniref:flavin-containing monooxygenase n=1 Tax=Streptomyces sp. NBC_00841 TaxID=2975847 RepID=UPI002DD94159|nr:NAD(P)/FAD-dependent oxidoreductase [Streptomyces sp. NBC_00841]WSA05791.1 NAD(P)/FAD-dependent oxidoreductase [Streptomyces sp. NBC_00841]